MGIAEYMVWVQSANGRGTMHVSSHRARNPANAARAALRETAADWGGREFGWTGDSLAVVGIANVVDGRINIIEWTDLTED